MIQLRGQKADGTPTYFMGLTADEANALFFKGMPLVVDLVDLGKTDDLTVIVLYGRTEQEVVDQLAAQGISVALNPEDGKTS